MWTKTTLSWTHRSSDAASAADPYLTLTDASKAAFLADLAAAEEEAQLQQALMLSLLEASTSGSAATGLAPTDSKQHTSSR